MTVQHFRGIIVAVQVGAVKIYVAPAVEALRTKQRQGETQETIKIDGFLVSPPPLPLNANVLFCRFFFQSHPVYDQTQGSPCCVCLTLRITLLHTTYLQNQKPRYKF